MSGMWVLAANGTQDIWQDFSFTTLDGLTLRGRDYGSRLLDTMPVVCLPGLTRSTRDFDEIATILSTDPETPRRVLALDYRGRGRSDYDPNWKNYNPLTEAGDVLNAIVAAGLQDVAILGTSRGGIIAMLLGSLRPGILRGVVLHDIGPEIDVTGLMKIKSYVSRMPTPESWDDAADILKTVHKGSFPDYGADDWARAARLTFADDNGHPVIDFDKGLIKTLDSLSPDDAPPTLWPQFMSLRSKPLLVIRGGTSDLLSEKTVETMDRAHPEMRRVTVRNEGHVPSLTRPEVSAALKDFFASLDHH
ncbi:MAG: alpha/beta hydrolase [Pseudomonadota bacterium]